MFGWTLLINKNGNSIPLCEGKNYIYNDLGVSCFYERYPKFENDKIFYSNEKYLIILDGIIFNNNKLIDKYSKNSWCETVIFMYEKYGEQFYDQFRGSFNGVIVDKESKKIISFTNQIGDRTVFYCENNENIIISSNFNYIVDLLKNNKCKYKLDENYVKYMLTFGFMLDETTCIENVKRLLPGYYLVYEKDNLETKKYFEFKNDEISISEEEALRRINETFINALKLEINKDKEYGYKSIMDISGGLDSRTVNYVSKRIGYNNILNISYSQMGSYEEKVTRELVKDLEFDYLYKALDNASFIYEVDEIIEKNYGLTIFSGFTGGKQILESLNLSNIGIQHTGLLGDINDGSFSSVPYHESPYFEDKYRFSNLLDKNILDNKVLEMYKTHELFCFYTRGLLGGLGTHLIRQNYIETYSPFQDIDFLNLTFQLPLDMRVNGIFKKWLIKYYPEATKIVYDHTMCKITDSKIKIKLKKIFIYLPRKIKRVLGFKNIQKSHESMNPYEYWYRNNKKLRDFVDLYYTENIDKLNEYPELKKLNEEMYLNGNVIDKMLMMTVLGTVKRYF